MRDYKLFYTNIYDYVRQRTRVIKVESIEDAKLWFENNLERDNLLDWIEEVEQDFNG